nr:hypothetical protein [Tanacetum cinerariifolium]
MTFTRLLMLAKRHRKCGSNRKPKWSRFVTIVKQQHKLDEVSYHKLFDILKQYQNEVNELRVEKLAKNANPLALRDKNVQKNLALTAKYFKKIYKPTNNNLRTSLNSKNKNVDTTPQYKNEDHSRQFGNQRAVSVAAVKEKVGSTVVQKSGIQCFNCKEYGHFAKEYRKPKRVKDSAYHKEKMFLCKQAEQVSNTCLVETYDSNVTPDSPNMCEDERVALANLIDNLKLDVDENKKIQNQLKKANTTLAQELKECKAILTKTSKTLGESISVRDSCLVALQTKQTEFEMYKAFNDYTVDYDKLEHKLNEALGQLAHKDTVIRECLKTKAYEFSVVKKHDELMKQSLLTKSHYEGVNHKPNVSIPQLKSNQSRDKVLPNNSQVEVKKTKVVVHPRIPSVSNKMKSVTACKDSLNSRTLNANIIQLIIFIVDSGCTKHMTGNLKLLCNFVEKFLGLNHNLFSVGQFCDADLEVAFRKSTCFVRDLQGNDLLSGNRGSDLYTISLQESTSLTLLCLMAKGTPTQACLWHRRLSYLNFDYINLLSKNDIMIGLPKLKYVKDQLCSSCEHKWEEINSGDCRRLLKIYLDFVSSFQGLNTRMLNDFLTMIQRNLQAPLITVRTDRGTEFLNKTLNAFFKEKGIEHQTSTARTPDQNGVNGVVERQNRTLVEAARTMLSALQLPLFFWAEAISTSTPSTHTNVHAEENNNDRAEECEQLQDDEFTNPFYAPAHEQAESSSHNIGNTNVPTFNQQQEELHQFDRLQVWELIDKPFGKLIIRLNWLWTNKNDEDQTVIRNKARLVAKGYAQEER